MSREPLHLLPSAITLAYNDPAENLRRIEAAVEEGLKASPGVPSESILFVFPELTLTGFVTRKPVLGSLHPPDALVSSLLEIAKRRRVGLVAGFPEASRKAGGSPRNCLVLAGPDGRVRAAYRKMHLFTVGDNPESAFYEPGETGTTCVYRGWRIGFAICFDLRFSALFFRYAKASADLVVVPACWIGGPHKSEQFRTLASAQAILMQSYLCAVNMSGKDPFHEYDGARYLFSPFGDDVFTGAPCALDYARLEACRKMKVRAADRAEYRVQPSPQA